jgi:hypothetical protein
MRRLLIVLLSLSAVAATATATAAPKAKGSSKGLPSGPFGAQSPHAVRHNAPTSDTAIKPEDCKVNELASAPEGSELLGMVEVKCGVDQGESECVAALQEQACRRGANVLVGRFSTQDGWKAAIARTSDVPRSTSQTVQPGTPEWREQMKSLTPVSAARGLRNTNTNTNTNDGSTQTNP